MKLELSKEQEALLARYAALLQTWSARMNLTAVRDPGQIAIRHFQDSLALCARLPEHVPGGSLIDVGTGAGFPGMLCALWRPGWQVTLVERTQKKVAFLMTVKRELGLTNVKPLAVDVQELVRAGARFGCVVSRAAFPPPEWLLLGAALTDPREGSQLWHMLTQAQADEHAATPPPGFRVICDDPYDVGAGPHRLRAFAPAPG